MRISDWSSDVCSSDRRLGEGGDGEPAPKPAREAGPAPAAVLEGVRVLDLGMFLAGPMGPSMMGDMGANVIKVEALTGDRIRFMHRYYQAAARSKDRKSVVAGKGVSGRVDNGGR